MGEKMIFSEKLYYGKGMNRQKLEKLKKRIDKKPLLCREYLLTIPDNPNSQLDLVPASQLIWDYYSRNPLHVVGVASDYKDALALVETITQECLRNRGDCALKEYLTC